MDEGDAVGQEFVNGINAQLEKIDLAINPVKYYEDKFNEVFGKYSEEQKALYELAKQGKLTAEILNNTTYNPLISELSELGITAQDVVDHINALSDVQLAKVLDPSFNITEYADGIDSIQENISSLQSALESLEDGSFTYSDFIDLIQQFPELAEGVDATSGNFTGLAKNLKKAIKAAPDELVDELKDLRAELVKTGKSTDAIDQLITSMENLPIGKVDDLANIYVTLADAINDASQAQGELAKAMEENPNANYENTSEAVQKMREMYANGAFGSESVVWDIFESLTGQTYDFSKSLTENKDVLKDWINTYSGMYLGKDDEKYAHKPIENFLNFMEEKVKEAQEAGEEWALATTWSYENGALDVDYENKYLEELAKAAGLTEAAFHDLMMQVAQFWAMEWEDGSDIIYYMDETLKSALESGENADEVLQKLGDAMEYFNKGNVDIFNRPEVPFDTENFESWAQHSREITTEFGRYSEEYRKWAQEELDAIESGEYTATVYSNTYRKSQFKELAEGEEDAAIVVTPILPDGTVLSPSDLEGYAQKILNGEEIDLSDGITLGIFEGDNAFEEANEFAYQLHEAQAIYYEALERFSAENILSQINDGGIEALNKINEIKSSVSKGASGEVFVDITSLTQALTEAQYTEDAIVDVIDKLNELAGVTLYDDESDPFGLYKATLSAHDMVRALENAGIAVEKTHSNDNGANGYVYNIDVREMSEVLASRGWTTNDIVSYINAATGSYSDGDIFAGMNFDVDTTAIDEALGKVDTLPEDADTDYTINVNTTFTAINDEWAKLTDDKKVDYIVNKKTVYSWGWDFANGTANANGTAFAGGNWGASKTETALVGELGPEMIVRGNRWFTVGDSGAEFTDIKKGDIIFNHQQTESLLKHGYITGRGKAYASGTAYSITNGTQNWNSNPTDINYKGDLHDASSSVTDAADKIKEDTKEVVDFIEVKLEEIEAIISKTAANLENRKDDTYTINAKDKDYDKLIAQEEAKASTYYQAITRYTERANGWFNKIPEEYRNMAKNGAIAIEDFAEADAETVEAINQYREWATKADDAEVGYLESIAQQAAYRVEQLNDIATDFENIIGLIDAESNLIQAQMDLVEASGERLSEAYYDELIDNSKQKRSDLEDEKKALQKILDDAVASGEVEKGTDEWYEMVNAIYEVDEKITQCDIDIEKFQNSIQDLRWDNLDKLIARFDAIDSELSHLYDRFTDGDKVVDESGNWTDEGIAALGVAAQQMETAQVKAKEYAEQIDYLNKNWKKDGYSVDEYNEKLAELTEKQWDEIEACEDAKDKIVDLNKTRIDAIKEGIKEEIDAYKELIDKKKEALDADKDLRDYERNVAEKQKEISDIERKLAAIRGDNSTSAAAKRAQLEADLIKANAELEDIYYEHSIETQKDAYDNEYEQFEEEKNKEMEALDEYLENQEQVIIDALNTVKSNTDIVLSEIKNISETYGIDISNAITKPWEDGEDAISGYKDKFEELTDSFAKGLAEIKAQEAELANEVDEAQEAINTIGTNVDATQAQQLTPSGNDSDAPVDQNNNTQSGKPGAVSGIGRILQIKSQGNDVKELQSALNALGFDCGAVDGMFGEKTKAAVQKYQRARGISADGIVGPDTKKKFELDGYDKGTLGVKDDEFAWIDEIGEELVLHADGSGKLAYLTKGSSVVPADITKKLMSLAVDPTQTLEYSRPVISAPQIVNNQIDIDMNFGEVIHIDTVTNDTIPDLTKAVEKQLDKYMKNLNNQIRKYAR